MPLELIKGDRHSSFYRDCNKWLETCSDLYDRFIQELEISPFEENEQSLVGFLAAGAAQAGYLPIVEMTIEKTKRGAKGPTNGRSDLWIDFGQSTYSFEAKRAKFMANPSNLSHRLAMAIAAIKEVGADEHDKAAAVLGAYVREAKRESVYRTFSENVQVDIAFRFGPPEAYGAYLFFGAVEA